MTVTKLRDRFSESEIDDETVLMLIDTGEFYSLTGTGRMIWRLIDGEADRDRLVAALAAEFDAPEHVLRADVDGFLAALADAGIVSLG